MALDTRLIGQALGLGRPADVAGAMEPAIQKGEKIFAEQRARREREQVRARQEQIRQENNTAKAIGLLQNIDESGVAANLRPYITQNALKIRNEALEKIKAAKTPAEKLTATMEANDKIGSLAARSNDFNKYLANFTDLDRDDVSAINKKDIGIQIGKILDGNFKITENGQFDFEDGKGAVDFNSVISTNYINKRSDTYLKLMDKANKIGMEAGTKGLSQETYSTLLEQGIASVEMSDLDALSVAIDHMKMDEIVIDGINTKLLVESLKEDFEDDNTINNKGNAEKMAKLKKGILDSVKKAGLSSESSYSTLKADYDRKVNIKNQKEDSFIKNEADKIYKTLIKATGPAQTGTGDIDKGLFVNKKLFGGYIIDSKDTPIKQDGNMLTLPLAVGKEDVEYKEIDLSNYNEVDNLMRELLVQKYGADANTDAILRIMPQVIGEFDPNWQMGGTMVMPKGKENDEDSLDLDQYEVNNELFTNTEIEDIINSGTPEARRKRIQEQKVKNKKQKEIDTLKRQFDSGNITNEYLRGSGKPILDNYKKTGKIDLSLRSN
jgi:hypothetical protein